MCVCVFFKEYRERNIDKGYKGLNTGGGRQRPEIILLSHGRDAVGAEIGETEEKQTVS